jgi:hypothetical protein
VKILDAIVIGLVLAVAVAWEVFGQHPQATKPAANAATIEFCINRPHDGDKIDGWCRANGR